MADGRKNNGGARPNSGPKTNKELKELRATLAEAIPEEKRQSIFKKMATMALAGDVQAAKLVLAYTYGTPSSGDEMLIQEGVNKIASEFYNKLTLLYGEERAREIISHLGAHPSTTGPQDDGNEVGA